MAAYPPRQTRGNPQAGLAPALPGPRHPRRIYRRHGPRHPNLFGHPSYWQIDGCPYFSFYDLPALIRSFGTLDETRLALADFRARVKAAGFRDLHLNQVLWNQGILPGERVLRSPGQILKELGFNSYTSYVWIHHAAMPDFPTTDYGKVFQAYLEYWQRTAGEIDLPYFPNATVGWDSSPRTLPSDRWENIGYPYTPILKGNTPSAFRDALAAIRERIETAHSPRILTLNSWNEWTEGSYLEPDEENGMGYLEAVRSVFPPRG